MTLYQASRSFMVLPLLLLLVSVSSCERTEDVAPAEQAVSHEAINKTSGDSTFISYNIGGGKYVRYFHLKLFIYAKEDSALTTPIYETSVKGEFNKEYNLSAPYNVLIPIRYNDCIYRYKIVTGYSLSPCAEASHYPGPVVIGNSNDCMVYYKQNETYLLDKPNAVGYTNFDVVAGYPDEVPIDGNNTNSNF